MAKTTEKTPPPCGAKTRSGGTCKAIPRAGEKRCYRHGAGRRDKPGGRPVVHGLYSKRLGALKTEAALEAVATDPNLLDLRRTVAISKALLDDLRLPDGDVDPVEANQALGRVLDALVKHGRLQDAAGKQAAFQTVLIQAVLPVIHSFAQRVMELSRRYVRPDQQQEFTRDLAAIVQNTQKELGALVDAA